MMVWRIADDYELTSAQLTEVVIGIARAAQEVGDGPLDATMIRGQVDWATLPVFQKNPRIPQTKIIKGIFLLLVEAGLAFFFEDDSTRVVLGDHIPLLLSQFGTDFEGAEAQLLAWLLPDHAAETVAHQASDDSSDRTEEHALPESESEPVNEPEPDWPGEEPQFASQDAVLPAAGWEDHSAVQDESSRQDEWHDEQHDARDDEVTLPAAGWEDHSAVQDEPSWQDEWHDERNDEVTRPAAEWEDHSVVQDESSWQDHSAAEDQSFLQDEWHSERDDEVTPPSDAGWDHAVAQDESPWQDARQADDEEAYGGLFGPGHTSHLSGGRDRTEMGSQDETLAGRPQKSGTRRRRMTSAEPEREPGVDDASTLAETAPTAEDGPPPPDFRSRGREDYGDPPTSPRVRRMMGAETPAAPRAAPDRAVRDEPRGPRSGRLGRSIRSVPEMGRAPSAEPQPTARREAPAPPDPGVRTPRRLTDGAVDQAPKGPRALHYPQRAAPAQPAPGDELILLPLTLSDGRQMQMARRDFECLVDEHGSVSNAIAFLADLTQGEITPQDGTDE